MLKITKSSEPIHVSTLTVCLYAEPGIGKTSMGFTAEKPLLLDFDKGSYRARNRRDVVQVQSWKDVTDITGEDLKGYSTLVVDTAGRALDMLSADIIGADPKMGRGGALTLQGYGKLKASFIAWTTLVRGFGLDIVLLAHMEEKQSGDEVKERLDIQGGSKGEVYKASDVMGRIYLAGGKRTLNLSPTDTAFGKNPGQLPPLEVPDFAGSGDFLAGVIAQTKAALNTLNEEQTKAANIQAEWNTTITALKTPEEFTAQIEPIKALDESVRDNIKRLLVKVGKEKGFALDPKTVTFGGAADAPKATITAVKTAEEGAKVAAKLSEAQEASPKDSTSKPSAETASADTSTAAVPTSREVGADDGDEDKGDAPSAAELEAAGQTTLKIAKPKKGKAA
jgi:hypothetical protein